MVHLTGVTQMMEKFVLMGQQPDVGLHIVGAQVKRWFVWLPRHVRRLLALFFLNNITDNHCFA